MKKIISGIAIGVCLGISFLLLPASASALDMGLVSTLVNKLGVTKSQAQGGSGAIFKTAESRMSKEDYKQLSDEVPEVDTLQKFAPKSKPSMLGSAASALGGKTGSSLGGATDLMSSFDSLGMDKDMLGKFTPVIYDYVKENGSEMVMGLLQKALSF
ncbi:MAG: DUF2780 domain-containing protein [Deltaproteobacteria bacterium]|nr:MAG: DUF2780 domain-containing protein [Deltaproteobacteria bacterium]